jgi:hypothetical protein
MAQMEQLIPDDADHKTALSSAIEKLENFYQFELHARQVTPAIVVEATTKIGTAKDRLKEGDIQGCWDLMAETMERVSEALGTECILDTIKKPN